jgi:hypothetical protein
VQYTENGELGQKPRPMSLYHILALHTVCTYSKQGGSGGNYRCEKFDYIGIRCERVRLGLHILVTIHGTFVTQYLKHSRSIVYIVIGIWVHTVIQSVYSLSILCVYRQVLHCV